MILVALGVGLLRPCSHLTFCKKTVLQMELFHMQVFYIILPLVLDGSKLPQNSSPKDICQSPAQALQLTFGATQVQSFSCNHLCCSCPCSAARRCWRNCEGPMQSRSSIESTVADTAIYGISTITSLPFKGCWMLLAYMPTIPHGQGI